MNINNTYIRNTTIINNRVNNYNYNYAHNVNAVTVASHNNFVNGQAINRSANHLTEASLRGAQVKTRADFTPTRQSFTGPTGARSHIATPSAAIQNRAVMARTTPAAAASHLPVRTLASSNAQPGRGGLNSGNAGSARAQVIGRTAQTGAAANSNRPSFSQNVQGAQRNAQQSSNGPLTNNQPGQGMSSRQRETSLDKPQSHMRNAQEGSAVTRGANSPTNMGNARNAPAQSTSTDRGRASAGSNTS